MEVLPLFKLGRLLAVMVLALMLGSCSKPEKAEYHKITAEEAKSVMDSGEEHVLLDVRTLEEYQESRIEGAILIPDSEIGERAEVELPDKKAKILVYCRSGRRSASAANELVGMGYSNVYDFGGITDWTYGTVSGE
jgi:rhodanese-related sulfurtransferase